MKAFTVLASLVLLGCSGLGPNYMVNLHSQLGEQKEMTVRFDGELVCSSRVSRGTHVGCGPVSSIPREATVTWAVPFEWRTPDKDRHLSGAALSANVPAWFTTGDAVVFTITENQELNVFFECHRMNTSCVGVSPIQVPSYKQ